MVVCRWSFAACGAPASERLTTRDVLTRLRLRPLKVDDHDRLEGLGFSVADIGPIAPLLHSLDGGGCQGSVSLDQSQTLNLAVHINHRFEDNSSLGRARAGSDGV